MLRRTLSTTWILFVILLFLTAVALAVARLWIPSLGSYRHHVEDVVGDILNRKVTIERLEATWRGISPVLKFKQLLIDGGREKRGSLAVREVWVSFDIKSYLGNREIQLNGINVIGAELTLVRDADGRIFVRELHDEATGGRGISGFPNIERLSIHDSTVTIIDEQSDSPPQRFTDVTLSLANQGDRHRVTGYAMLPPGLGYRVDVNAALVGMPGDFSDWQGRVYLKGQALALSSELAIPLPDGLDLQGVADARFWLDIDAAQVHEVRAELDMHDFRMAHQTDSKAYHFEANRLTGQFGWQVSGQGWRFTAQRVNVEQEDQDWQTASIALAGRTQEGVVYLTGTSPVISLDVLSPLLLALPVLTNDQKHQLAGVQPQGLIEDLYFAVAKSATTTDVTAFNAAFTGLGFRQSQDYPFVSGLDGKVSGALDAGIITLDTREAAFHNDRLFRDALSIVTARGEVRWRKTAGQIEITADEFVVDNRDLALTAAFGVDIPRSGGPAAVDLRVDLAHADIARVYHYLPARIMSVKGVAWLDRSLVSGTIRDGTFVVQGPIDKLPFDHGEGRLEAHLPVTNAVLDYHPDWSPVTALDAQVDFSGRAMDITGRKGSIRTAELQAIHAQIKDLQRPELLLKGTVQGSLPVMLAELGSGPLGKTYGGFVDHTSTSGNAGLELDLVIPLYRGHGPAEVRGKVSLSGNTLAVKDTEIELTDIKGAISFDPDSVSGENLAARLFDNPVTVNVWKDSAAGRTQVGIDGRLGLLDRMVGESDAVQSFVSGSTDWQVLLGIGALESRREMPDLDLKITSSLTGIEVDLPAPFAKPANSSREFRLRVKNIEQQDKLLQFSYGNQLQGQLEVKNGDSGFTVRRGMITLDNTVPVMPVTDRLVFSGHLDQLQLSRWTSRFEGGPMEMLPIGFNISVDELEVLRHILRDVNVEAEVIGPVWTIRARGDTIAGDITLTRGKSGLGKVNMELERLILESIERPEAETKLEIQPATFPDMQVKAKQLVYDKTDFGRFAMTAEKTSANQVAVDSLTLSSAVLSLNLQGDWKSGEEQQISSFDVQVSGGDLGKLLETFNYEATIAGGALSGSMHATWPGPPWAFSLPALEGRLKLRIKNGQLLDLEPGAAGRVIGLLSLASLQRRLSLDFSDLFGEGFSFDQIKGDFIFESGNAYTSDLTIKGPAANIEISGRTGLASKDYDQLVTVTPQMQTGLAVAGTLAGGPAVGAALVIADKLLEGNLGPLSRLSRRQYTVQGPWSNPEVKRINAPERDEQEDTFSDFDDTE